MESNKVKLLKEEAEAIELMKAKGASLNAIVSRHVTGNLLTVNHYKNVEALDLDTLIRALYIGYVVEQTPREVTLEILQAAERLEDLSKDELEHLMVKFTTATNYLHDVKKEVMSHIAFRPNREKE